MTIEYYGPCIRIHYDANELSSPNVSVQLPDGYTYETIYINFAGNISSLVPTININKGDHLTFPIVNSRSPSILYITVSDITRAAELGLTIEKFGQIPDPHYFDEAFEPILVTGEDGNKYNVIPSDQFK